MTVLFNHAIIAARDRRESTELLVQLLGLDEPNSWGPFAIVALDNGAFLQFAGPGIDDIQKAHSSAPLELDISYSNKYSEAVLCRRGASYGRRR